MKGSERDYGGTNLQNQLTMLYCTVQGTSEGSEGDSGGTNLESANHAEL
jgi:hypothetical protein